MFAHIMCAILQCRLPHHFHTLPITQHHCIRSPHLRAKTSRPVAIAGICSSTTSTRRHRCILLPPDTCTSPGWRITSRSRSLARRYIQVDPQGHRTYVGRLEKELCLYSVLVAAGLAKKPYNLYLPYVWSSIRFPSEGDCTCVNNLPCLPCGLRWRPRCRFSTSRNVDRDAGTHT